MRKLSIFLALLLAIEICAMVRAEQIVPITTRPATEPAKISVTVDTSKTPELEEWGKKAQEYATHWYPLIAERLESDGFTPPTEVKLVFVTDYKGVAYTTGTIVTISDKWVKAHPEDIGMVAHEITHVIQHYTRRNKAGWLTEGMADYIRYYFVEPGTKHARFNIQKSNWNTAYQPAAGFLDYCERTYPEKHIVSTLNFAMRKGKYSDDMFMELTGKTPDELWSDFKNSRESKAK